MTGQAPPRYGRPRNWMNPLDVTRIGGPSRQDWQAVRTKTGFAGIVWHYVPTPGRC